MIRNFRLFSLIKKILIVVLSFFLHDDYDILKILIISIWGAFFIFLIVIRPFKTMYQNILRITIDLLCLVVLVIWKTENIKDEIFLICLYILIFANNLFCFKEKY